MTAASHASRAGPLRWFDSAFADPVIEADFQRSESDGALLYSRTAIGLAAVLFTSFGITDWLFAVERAPLLTLVRMAVVAILLGSYAAMHVSGMMRHRQSLMQVAAFAVGVGFVVVAALTPLPLRELYLNCVILVLMGIFVVLRLSVLRAVLVELVVIGLFDLVYLLLIWRSLEEFVVLQTMIVSAFAIGLFCNYVFERQRRMAYLGRADAELQATSLQLALRRTAEAQLHAEEAARVKTDFVAHVSHELRTPLNAVIGFGEVLEKQIFGPLGNPKYAEYARDIRESGQHLLSLINDVLDLSKIEAGRMNLHREALPPDELVRASLVLVSGLAQARGTTVRVEMPDDLPAISGDARAVKQMLVNLLSNALKFTPPGGDVCIRAESLPRCVALTVSDDGPGMTPEQQTIALTPFGQVSGMVAGTERGTGLGLALANRLAELHGAPLDIRSAPGRGTQVTFRLPMAATEMAAD